MSAVLQPVPGFTPMTEADLDAVLAVEQDIYPFPWTRGNFRDSVRAGYSCWLYREGHRLLGYAVLLLAAGEAHLLNLSIARAEQHRGHGRRFLLHLIEVAREYGAGMLFLEVRPSNEAGKRLYMSHGFMRIGVRRAYYPASGGREDAWVYALNL